MQFPYGLKAQIDQDFLHTWEVTLRRTVQVLNPNLSHDCVNQILVEAFWSWKGKKWIENPRVLKGLFGSKLDVIRRCIGQNLPVFMANELARCMGSNLTPNGDFWNELSSQIKLNSAIKSRLINSIRPACDEESEEVDLKGGIEILKNKPFVLRPYQLEIIEAIYSEIVLGNERLTLKLPTGSGKTRIALEAIYKLMFEKQVNVVLWIADEKQLCEQAVDSAKMAFQNSDQGVEELLLVSFFDSKALTDLEAILNSNDANMLIICTPDQLSQNLDLIPDIDLFVMDESHTSVQQRLELYESSKAKTMLGLSATPPLHWTENKTLTPRKTFDSTRMSTEVFLRGEGVLSRLQTHNRSMMDFDIGHESLDLLIGQNIRPQFNDSFVTYSILWNLINDMKENLVTSSIVFVERVEQAAILSAAFNKLMPDYRAEFIEGNTPKTQRHALLRQFRDGTIDVLFNVNMLREGFDSPNIDGVYLAKRNNPELNSTKYIQMVGRGLRGTGSEGGTETCHVVTIDYSYE